jgi:hypothetical protein
MRSTIKCVSHVIPTLAARQIPCTEMFSPSTRATRTRGSSAMTRVLAWKTHGRPQALP